MLSGVLTSHCAVEVNVAIMRAFVKMRKLLASHHPLARKLQELEHKLIAHDYQIEEIVNAIRQMTMSPTRPKRRIGYVTTKK